MPKKKRTPVAALSHGNGIHIGASDVIRWGDVVTIQGHDIDISKAVELGVKYDLDIAHNLKKDLMSKRGLLVTFPLAILMDQLQSHPKVQTGTKLLALVKA